ncbi:MAG: cupredoxin domain-containing protein [Nitrososphaerota archaeon]|nr:cupredoxin domain-containing protein [Nitrososphaerota archaeon]
MTATRVVIIAAAAIVVILAVTGVNYFLLWHPRGSATETIVVTAGPRLAPANLTLMEGQHVTIIFDNTDDGPHEFRIGTFGVSTGIVRGGQTTAVSFIPNKIGTFTIVQPCPQGPAPTPCGIEGYVTVLPP